MSLPPFFDRPVSCFWNVTAHSSRVAFRRQAPVGVPQLFGDPHDVFGGHEHHARVRVPGVVGVAVPYPFVNLSDWQMRFYVRFALTIVTGIAWVILGALFLRHKQRKSKAVN